MSFTFDILDPGPFSLLNNMCGALCGNSYIFSYLLWYFDLVIYISTACDRFSTDIARY